MASDNTNNKVEEDVEKRLTWTEWLTKKDAFLSTYPKDKQVLEGDEWDALIGQRPMLWEYQLPKTLTVESLEELSEVLGWGDTDPEAAHSYEKDAMNMFIAGVAKGIYTPEETQKLAQKLVDIAHIPFSRWFA